MAGAVGLEPTHGGTRTRCLTTWRRPNALLIITQLKLQTKCREFFIASS